jgi:hypothetical protein
LDTRKSTRVAVPMLNSLAAAINLGVFTSDIRLFYSVLFALLNYQTALY